MSSLKELMNTEPAKIDCANKDWKTAVKTHLQQGTEVDLSNFYYTENGQFCEMMALAHSMQFRLDAKNSAGFFRKSPC